MVVLFFFIRATGYRATFCKLQRHCDVSILCQSCLCLVPSTKKQEELIPTSSCLSKFLSVIGFPGHLTPQLFQNTTVKYHRSRVLLSYFTLQPMKMDLIEGSETSAIINQTPGNYPKENSLP